MIYIYMYIYIYDYSGLQWICFKRMVTLTTFTIHLPWKTELVLSQHPKVLYYRLVLFENVASAAKY